MKKRWLSSILFISSMAYAQTPAEIVQQFYPKHSKTLPCRLATPNDSLYCMRLYKTETRTTPQGKMMYLLYGGNFVNEQTGEEWSGHSVTGLAGMFVLREQSPNNWTLVAAEPHETVGSFGAAPDKMRWTFHEFGQNRWGFLTRHSDVHQGHSGSHYVVLAHDGSKKISVSWIGATLDTTGAYGENCEYFVGENKVLSAAERKECVAKLASVDSQIKILRDKTMVKGFYPLQITLNGYQGNIKFRNKTYVIPFNARKLAYIEPKSYPLANIDY